MNKETVKKWITLAEDDWKVILNEFNSPEPVLRDICFHSQQCVEKLLKAYLIFHGKEIRKTHDIAELIEICKEVNPEFEELLKWDVDKLTKYAVEIRYPDDMYFPTFEEAEEARKLADKAKEFIIEKLKESGFDL